MLSWNQEIWTTIFDKPENAQNPVRFFDSLGTPYIRFLCYRKITRYKLQEFQSSDNFKFFFKNGMSKEITRVYNIQSGLLSGEKVGWSPEELVDT